jgi:glycine dehydrogenase subunit 1
MDYTPHTEEEIKQMLSEIGLERITDLFNHIPENVKFNKELNIDKGISELEVIKKLKSISSKNNNYSDKPIFLGAGFYDHYVPQAVDFLSSRGEFLTSYTPYQAEVSQGTLQSIYEFQTVIARLTGHEISNASMYDGGSALAEAILMGHTINKKGKKLILPTINPEYVEITKTYAEGLNLDILYPEYNKYTTNLNYVREILEKEQIAVLAIQIPNFFGFIEDYESIIKLAKEKDIIVVASTYPIALGMIKPPSSFGADITVGEGQPLGNYISLGGPHFGFLACREKFLRKMPGRLVGETVDTEGKKGYCLIVQTREQHIKREKATSNICSNQALCALRGVIYLSMTGENGMKELAVQNYQKAHYLANLIDKLDNFSVLKDSDFFNEFIIECKDSSAKDINEKLKKKNIIGGYDLSRINKENGNHLMIAVTEKRTKEELDLLVKSLSS